MDSTPREYENEQGRDLDLLAEIDGSFRDLVETRALVRSKSPQLPACWYEAVSWVEKYGYVARNDSSSNVTRFLASCSSSPAALQMFLELSLACCLYSYERHERTRVLYTFPESLRMPTICRFEELRVNAVPPREVSQWAVSVHRRSVDELFLGSRLTVFSYIVGAFGCSHARELRALLYLAKVSEEKVMAITQIAPKAVKDWYDAALSLAYEGGIESE